MTGLHVSAQRGRLLAALGLVAALVAAALVIPGGDADAYPRWAPVSTAKITPGVQTYTKGAQCTANFVFTDAANNVYVGQAAHCASRGGSSDLNGCTTPTHPVGTPVTFGTGGNLLFGAKTVGAGTLAYSSWATMQKLKWKGPLRCLWNDFALIKVNKADLGKVNPSVPYWGGPRTIGGNPLGAGAKLFTVGNSSLRTGKAQKKTATVIRHTGGGLGYDIKGGAGVPGDSGSGYMDVTGRAIGVLSTISVGISSDGLITNTLGDLYQELTWARQYSGIKGLKLAVGTVPFKAS